MTQESRLQRRSPDAGDRLQTTQVRDVMHPGIVSCSQAASVAEIARIMASCRVHCVAVIGLSQDERQDPLIWGIVSDLDLLGATTESGRPQTAATLARQPVISVRPTMSVHDAAKAMVDYNTTHVVVVDPDLRTPLGILSTLDVAELLAGGTT